MANDDLCFKLLIVIYEENTSLVHINLVSKMCLLQTTFRDFLLLGIQSSVNHLLLLSVLVLHSQGYCYNPTVQPSTPNDINQ